MPNPYFITQLLEQLLEPGRIATAFKTHHHLLSAKLLVKLPHFSRLLVVQLQPFYLSIFSCQIAERLLARMKVDPDIYCHRRLLLLTQIVSTVSLTTNGRRRLLHNIRPDPNTNTRVTPYTCEPGYSCESVALRLAAECPPNVNKSFS